MAYAGGDHLPTGHGASFALHDPNGIRPGFWYEDDEVVAVASERTALVTCFNVPPQTVKEVTPGTALIIAHRPEAGTRNDAPPAPSADRLAAGHADQLSGSRFGIRLADPRHGIFLRLAGLIDDGRHAEERHFAIKHG
jgi:asparagine synthetase B (glutamine-hydrolysing)